MPIIDNACRYFINYLRKIRLLSQSDFGTMPSVAFIGAPGLLSTPGAKPLGAGHVDVLR